MYLCDMCVEDVLHVSFLLLSPQNKHNFIFTMSTLTPQHLSTIRSYLRHLSRFPDPITRSARFTPTQKRERPKYQIKNSDVIIYGCFVCRVMCGWRNYRAYLLNLLHQRCRRPHGSDPQRLQKRIDKTRHFIESVRRLRQEREALENLPVWSAISFIYFWL